MKKFLLILFLGLQFLGVEAQVAPWVSKGATWIYTFSDLTSGQGGYDKIEYVKDTLILGKTVQALKLTRFYFGKTGPNAPISFLYSTTHYPYKYTYSIGDTVFYYENNNFKILYNFGASVTDTWDLGVDTNGFAMCSKSVVKVDSISTMVIGSNSHRLLYTSDSSIFSSVGILGPSIEHIGSMNYLFPTPRNCNPQFSPDYYIFSFVCFSDDSISYKINHSIDCDNPWGVGVDENYLFQNLICIFPNPSNGIFKIEFSNSNNLSVEVIDIYGSIIQKINSNKQNIKIDLSTYSNGIYFVRVLDEEGRVGVKKIVKQ